jgi:hypothetical protein
MRSIKVVLLCGALALGVATPARAASVSVSFGVSLVGYAPTGAACPLTVPAGSDGVAVLDAAVDAGCITSYRSHSSPPFGEFVDCIDEVCGAPAEAMFLTYWKYWLNGAPASSGVSFYSAEAGDELVFSYSTWAGCLAVPDDPNVC